MGRGEDNAPILSSILVIIALAQGRGTVVQFYSEGIWNCAEEE